MQGPLTLDKEPYAMYMYTLYFTTLIQVLVSDPVLSSTMDGPLVLENRLYIFWLMVQVALCI